MLAKNKALLIILLITPLFGLGIDLYSPSIPIISTYFDVSDSVVKLTIVLYLVGYGIGQMAFGPLSDRFGRKIILEIGLLMYLIVTVVLALTTHPLIFLLGRFVQGVFISSAGVINKALLSDHFSGKELEKATAYMVIVWAIGPIIAPAIGSYIQVYLSWKMNFVLLAVYASFSLLLTRFLLLNFIVGNSSKKIKEILNDYIEISKNKEFVGFAIILATTYALLVAFSIAGPFIIQIFLGKPVIEYGHIALFIGFGFFLGTMLNRVLIGFFSAEKIIYTSILCSTLIAIMMLYWNFYYSVTTPSVAIPTFGIIFFSAIITPNSYVLSLRLFSEKAGTATALRGVLTLLGASIFVIPIILTKSAVHPWELAVEYIVLSILALLVFYQIVSLKRKITYGSEKI